MELDYIRPPPCASTAKLFTRHGRYLTKTTKPLEITVNTRFPFSSTETPLAHFGLSIKLTVLPVKSIPLVSAYFPTFDF